MIAPPRKNGSNHNDRAAGRPAVPQSSAGLPVLIDIETLALRLGVGIRHVRRLVAERRIPYVKVGHYVRFDTAEVARWIDQRRVQVFRD